MLGHNHVFIDSFQFKGSSLEKISQQPSKRGFKIYIRNESKAVDLMSKKGAHPYDYMDSFQKFNQTTLPTKELLKSTKWWTYTCICWTIYKNAKKSLERL